MKTKSIIATAGVLMVIGLSVWALTANKTGEVKDINNGGLVACTMEAKLCPDGSYVGRTGPKCEFTACPEVKNNPPQVSGGCFVGGCSSQICSDQEGAISTCEYREEYACYKTAKCERQTSGSCGWTQTSALSSCLNSSGRIAAGYVAGHVTIGPNCPVEQAGKPCEPSPEAYTSREAVIYESNGNTIKDRFHLDAQGNFKIALMPGTYWIQIVPAGIGSGEKKQFQITSFETITVNFDIDTGIR